MSTRYDTDPGSKSAEEVQQEVRQSRAALEDTLDEIQRRLSPGQMFDQAVDYLRGSGGNEFLRNFGAAVRDNPVPVVLMGTGLAWLMMAGGRRRDEDAYLGDYAAGHYGAGDDPAGYHPAGYGAGEERFDYGEGIGAGTDGGDGQTSGGKEFAERAKRTAEAARRRVQQLRGSGHEHAQGLSEAGAGGAGSWGGHARERAQEWGAEARSAAAGAAERARRLGAGARERLGDTGDYLRHGVHGAQERASRYGRHVQRGFVSTLHEQPLVLGALGLAVGAAIGAALPRTETEDEWLGETRDQLKDRAERLTREQIDRARAAGRAAYDAAIEEADRQGWSAEGAMSAVDAAAEKAERVAEAATEAAKSEAERHGGAGSTGSGQPGTGRPTTEAERHGLGQTGSRIPSGA
jgi:hypothetical protein